MAFVEERARTTFDVTAEGGSPPFVLEVVSPSSVARDQQEKRHAYALLGAREYVLFTPREGTHSTLEGYRRDAAAQFQPWVPDEQGRLWSEVLGLFLIVRGPLLQAQTVDGRLLLTPEQSGIAVRAAEEAYQRAEDEIERLRHELERYRGQGGE